MEKNGPDKKFGAQKAMHHSGQFKIKSLKFSNNPRGFAYRVVLKTPDKPGLVYFF